MNSRPIVLSFEEIIDNAATSEEIVWQPVCEKRADILSTRSKTLKTVHTDSFLPLTTSSIKIH